MPKLFSIRSFRTKLLFIIWIGSTSTLFLACGCFIFLEISEFDKDLIREMNIISNFIADKSAQAIMFNDPAIAEDALLRAAAIEPAIVNAVIYDADATVVATYASDIAQHEDFDSPEPQQNTSFRKDAHLHLFSDINMYSDRIGTIYIKADRHILYERIQRYGIIVAGIMSVSLLFLVAISFILQKLISKPVMALIASAKQVSEKKDYAIRVKKQNDDELGVLVDAFNEMLAQIEESEEQFRNLVEQSPVAISIMAPDGRVNRINAAFMNLWGIRSHNLPEFYEKYNLLKDEQSRKLGVMPLIEKAFSGEAVIVPPIEYDAQDTMKALNFTEIKGNKRWVQSRLYPVKNKKGETMSIVRMGEDITERKEAETALNEARVFSDNLIETANVMIIGLDVDGNIQLFNPTAEAVTGYSMEELEGKNWFEILVPGEKYPDLSKEFQRILDGAGERTFENPILTKEGEERIISWSNNEVKGRGSIWGTVSFGVDITERKQAEKELRASEEKFSKVFFSSPDAITITTLKEGTIVEANEGFEKLFGYAPSEVIGRSTNEINLWLRSEDRDDMVDILNRDGHLRDYEVDMRSRSGEVKSVSMSIALMELHGEQHSVTVGRDITERKNAEERLMQSEAQLRKLAIRLQDVEEMERKALARELHDQVGQNLTALNINLNILASQIPDDVMGKARSRLFDSMALVEETTKSIRDVMAELRPAVLDDYGLIAALRWYGQRFEERTGVSVELQGEDGSFRLPGTLESAIFRIVQEALTNVAKHADASRININIDASDDNLHLLIADNGKGFDAAAVQKTGEPRGWGILNMRERAHALGGEVHVDSKTGEGTKVNIHMRM